MREILTGLAVAGLLAGAGCSGSGDGGDGAAASDGAGASDEGGGFCAAFAALDERFREDVEAANDPQQIIDALESLEPPPEIADDFQTMVEVYEATASIDMEDPAAIEEAQQLSERAVEAEVNLRTYLDEECGITNSPDGPPAGE